MTFPRMPADTRTNYRLRLAALGADCSTSFLFLFTLLMLLTWTCYGHAPGTSGESIILSSLAAPLGKLPPQAQSPRHTALPVHDKHHTTEDVAEEDTTPQSVLEVPPLRCCSRWAALFGAPCNCIDAQFYEWGG
ncbi:uncharacterized protein [Penaeus vannamei]|uniref:uncharacterized protein n=1 Tax=Penaeus vannamei TaxID=6689 RepID=UPI00387F70A0